MVVMPASAALRRLSTSLDSRTMRIAGMRCVYQAAATRMARSLRSFGVSPGCVLMKVSLQIQNRPAVAADRIVLPRLSSRVPSQSTRCQNTVPSN